MSNELLRAAWKELAYPLVEKYIQDLFTKRFEANDWPETSVFSDLCKPFKLEDKEGKPIGIQVICIVPPTPSFWSAILAMYVLFGRKTFRHHQKACKIFLRELNRVRHHVLNLTEHWHVIKWLQESEVGYEGLVRNDKNIFMINPVVCLAALQNDLMVVQGTKDVDSVLNLDPKLIEHFQMKYDEISKRLEAKPNDGQSQGNDQHGVEGERRLGVRDGDGSLGGASDGDAKERPDELFVAPIQDIWPSDPDPIHGQ